MHVMLTHAETKISLCEYIQKRCTNPPQTTLHPAASFIPIKNIYADVINNNAQIYTLQNLKLLMGIRRSRVAPYRFSQKHMSRTPRASSRGFRGRMPPPLDLEIDDVICCSSVRYTKNTLTGKLSLRRRKIAKLSIF